MVVAFGELGVMLTCHLHGTLPLFDAVPNLENPGGVLTLAQAPLFEVVKNFPQGMVGTQPLFVQVVGVVCMVIVASLFPTLHATPVVEALIAQLLFGGDRAGATPENMVACVTDVTYFVKVVDFTPAVVTRYMRLAR